MANVQTTDYCIVGAGIAGLLIASRLAKSGKQVVVLEQGPRITESTRSELIARATVGLEPNPDYNDHLDARWRTPASGLPVARLFGTGGTALHFAGWMARPVAADLSVRTQFGYGRDWPISYAELEPWLLRAEHEIGVAGGDGDNPYASTRSGPFPMPAHRPSWFDRTELTPALTKLGMTAHSSPYAINSRPYQHADLAVRPACSGCRICKFCPTGARYSPDRVHGTRLQKRENVEILAEHSLRRLETSPTGERIVAAHAMTVPEHEHIIIRAHHYVLAMGGIETARMLLLSSSGGIHRNGIGNAGGQVGAGFNGHSASSGFFEMSSHTGASLGFPTLQCDHGTSVDRHTQPSWVMQGGALADASQALAWATNGDQLSLDRLRKSLTRMGVVFVMNETAGAGRLDLDPEQTDSFGDRVARLERSWTDWDQAARGQTEQFVQALAERLGAVNLSHVHFPAFSVHPSGATAMGTSPDNGVCDADAKVFGIDNLHLCSSSVFPHMGAGPPTLTIAALALRLANHIEGKS